MSLRIRFKLNLQSHQTALAKKFRYFNELKKMTSVL